MGCHHCLIYTRMLIYIGTIALHSTNIIIALSSVEEPKIEEVSHFSRLPTCFFSCWPFVFQMIYAAFALFCDWKILENTSEKNFGLPQIVTNFRDSVFTVTVFPASLLASTYFWSFYIFDSKLLFPDFVDTALTPTSGHVMHLLVIPLAMLELVLYPRRKPDSSVVRLFFLYGVEVIYVSALFCAYKSTGTWAYPIIGQVYGTIYLPLFLGVTTLYLSVLYFFQFCFSTFVIKCRERLGRKYCSAYRNQCGVTLE